MSEFKTDEDVGTKGYYKERNVWLEEQIHYYEIIDYEKTVGENRKLKKQMVFLLKWIKEHLKYMNIDYVSFKRNFEDELKALESKE